MTDATRWNATLHVGGLPQEATSQHLHDAFLPFGDIVEVTVPKPSLANTTDSHRGFAYVEFEDAADAREAVDNMDQSELMGKLIRVSVAKPPKSADEGLGSRTAVWEQESWLAKHAVSEEDKLATENAKASTVPPAPDPMQGLEGLDVAGPRPL